MVSLAELWPPIRLTLELAALVTREAVSRAKVNPDDVGHLVFGNVIHTEPADMYLARVAAIRGGLSESTPALTVNRLCGSALQAVLSAADYVEAVRRRRELAVEFARALANVDVAVSANATGPAPLIDSVSTYSTFERASYTAPYNLTGSPALSVPIGFENGLPLAFQIVGKPFDEAMVMRVGHTFEQATEFHRQRPAIAASLPSQG